MDKPLKGSLNGIRVLDLTHALAGSFCSQILADHGANVIKIEPLEGDFFRRMGPFREDDAKRYFGGLFQSCNRNKRSLAVNLKTAEGQALLQRLVEKSDVVVENYRTGVLDRLNLGYQKLKTIKPSLVYTSVRGFGDRVGGESPYMMWPAFDITAQAMGGWMGITGPDAEHTYKVGGGVGDTVPGLFAALGTMVALWHAKATGEGQYVDVSMVDCILAMSELVVSQYSYLGISPSPHGNGILGVSPFGTVRASDGVVAIAAPHDSQWAELCQLLGRPELARDERFINEESRWNNNSALMKIIESITCTKTKKELRALLSGRVPFSPIYTALDIFEDSHFRVREMLPEVDHPGSARPVSVPGIPVKLSASPGSVHRRAPILGEHTYEVLAEIGMTEREIDILSKSGIILTAHKCESLVE